MAMRHVSRLGTTEVNAIVLPSGDHSMPDGVSVRREICVVAPSASIQRTKICCPLGSPFATYAMRVPSGDHRTSEPCTSCRARVPSVLLIQMDDSHLSLILSIHRREYAIWLPLGENCGAWTSSQSRYCSRAIRFWVVRCWAESGADAAAAATSHTAARAIAKGRIEDSEKGSPSCPARGRTDRSFVARLCRSSRWLATYSFLHGQWRTDAVENCSKGDRLSRQRRSFCPLGSHEMDSGGSEL